MDVVDPEIAVDTSEAIASSSSYGVNTDGRGQASLISPAGTIVLDFVLTSGSHGLVTEFDGNGTGSGTLDLQTALTGQSQLAGSYAFALGGFDASGNPSATVGAFALDQNGNITTGAQDINDNGVPILNPDPFRYRYHRLGHGPGVCGPQRARVRRLSISIPLTPPT